MNFLNFNDAKSCPFCGGKPYDRVCSRRDGMIKVSIGCTECEISFAEVIDINCSAEKIIEAYNKCVENWNRRV